MGLKLAGYLIAFVLVAGSYYYAFDKGGDLREAEIKAGLAAANNETAKKAAKGAEDANKKLSKSTDEILHAAPGDDGPLAPVLRRQLERMRTH